MKNQKKRKIIENVSIYIVLVKKEDKFCSSLLFTIIVSITYICKKKRNV